MTIREPINKTMDRADLAAPEAARVVAELDDLVRRLRARGVRVSSWYGEFDLSGDPDAYHVLNRGLGYEPLRDAADDVNFPWFLYWEIAWLWTHGDYRPGQALLDLGGSSSLFSYYAADQGLDVTTIDLRPGLVENADRAAAAMGWSLRNEVMDMRALALERRFDHVTSVCVFEHVPVSDRVAVTRGVRDLLVDGGSFAMTFDYRNPSRLAAIGSPEDVDRQFVQPSGLEVVGNERFHDGGENHLLHPFYHPRLPWRTKVWHVRQGQFPLRELPRRKRANDYTFGALFQRKS